MPLSEGSSNAMSKNGAVTHSEDFRDHVDAFDPGVPALQSTPSSIQSMLKNTTETGDIGQFSIQPSHIKASRRRMSPITSHFLQHEIDLPQHQVDQLDGFSRQNPRYDSEGRQSSLASYNGTTTTSGVISMYQSEGQNSVRIHSRPRPIQNVDNRAFSLSQSSNMNYSLSSCRSYSSLRSRSPFAYPTRLRRPGYRPSSPALPPGDYSDVDSRTEVGFETGSNIRTPSPSSHHTVRTGPSFPCNNFNQPVPSLTYSPEVMFQSAPHYRERSMRTPSRTRKSSRNTEKPFDPRERSHNPRGSIGRSMRSPSPSPLYYDYSEDFAEEFHHRTESISVSAPVEQTLLENEVLQVYHELEGDTVDVKSSALLVGNFSPDSHDAEASDMTENASPASIPGKLLVQTPTWADSKVEIEVERSRVQEHGKDYDGMVLKESDRSVLSKPKDVADVGETMGHYLLSSSRLRNRDMSSGLPNKTVLVSPARSEPSQRVDPSGVFSEPPQRLPPAPPYGNRSSTLYWKLPSFHFSHLNLRDAAILASRPGSICAQLESRDTALHAPVAARPPTTQSHQGRFSRILSIGEDFTEAPGKVDEAEGDYDHGARGQREDVSEEPQSSHPTFSTRLSCSSTSSVVATSITGPETSDETRKTLSIDCSSLPSQIPTAGVKTGPQSPIVRKQISSLASQPSYISLPPGTGPATGELPFSFVPLARSGEVRSMPMDGNEITEQRISTPAETSVVSYESKLQSTTTLSALQKEINEQPFEPESIMNEQDPRKKRSVEVAQGSPYVRDPSRSTTNIMKIGQRDREVTTAPKKRKVIPLSLLHGGPLGRKNKTSSNLSDIDLSAQTTTAHTQLTACLDSRPSSAPQVVLASPSPGLHFGEVRSFFSDDSSQLHSKGSFRQRLSHLKAVVARVSSDDVRSKGDHRRTTSSGLVKKARENGRMSPQIEDVTIGMSSLQYAKLRMLEKVKGWWQWGQGRVKGVGGKMKKPKSKTLSVSTDMFPGV